MSVEALAIALNHSRASGTAKIVMIGIANHDGDGGAWPSIATLARYANVDERSVQRSLDRLERLGEIRRHRQKGGTHLTSDARRPNLYEVLLRCPADCDGTSQHRTRKQRERALPLAGLETVSLNRGVTPVSPHLSTGVTPVSPGGVTPVSPEPVLGTPTHLSRTKPTDRARAKTPVWATDRCPGDWKTSTHRLGSAGRCVHCHERPHGYADPETGEVR